MYYVDELYEDEKTAKAVVEWYKKNYDSFLNYSEDNETGYWRVWGKYYGWD